MRFIGRLVAVLALGAGCAGRVFPPVGDPNGPIAEADQAISAASNAGADSLASEALTSAKQNVAVAREEQRQGRLDRAALAARQAAADAVYARAAAERAAAERAQRDAQTAYSALPPGGSR